MYVFFRWIRAWMRDNWLSSSDFLSHGPVDSTLSRDLTSYRKPYLVDWFWVSNNSKDEVPDERSNIRYTLSGLDRLVTSSARLSYKTTPRKAPVRKAVKAIRARNEAGKSRG